MEGKTKHQYIRIWAWTSLPDSHYVYEAQRDLQCAACGATIPVNSYFARKLINGKANPLPCCRECRPFNIYTNQIKVIVVPRDEEYLHVSEV